MTEQTIEINGKTRLYYIVNRLSFLSQKVLLCFPGGGDTIQEFLQYTGFSEIDSGTVIIFQGQDSINTYTWQNAFPWLYRYYQDDVVFVDRVLETLGLTKKKIFLVGKSDGAGFCGLYSNLSRYTSNIRGIAICSSAIFGLYSIYNDGNYTITNAYKNNIPYNMIFPPRNIPLFMIHGTDDTVMPYLGQNFLNSKAGAALTESAWNLIDPTVSYNPITNETMYSNTYTTAIFRYLSSFAKERNYIVSPSSTLICSPKSIVSERLGLYTTVYTPCSFRFGVMQLLSVCGMDHDWLGHTGSGPNSAAPGNLQADATYLFLLFFHLPLGKYIPTNRTIPCGLRTYKGCCLMKDRRHQKSF